MFERDPAATPPLPAGDPLAAFHPVVRAWFESRFSHPTDAQAEGWPRIHAGETTLIAAPTGSGKTLAAFLVGIDQLIREAEAGELEDATRIVYVSPLKALSNDIQRNLEEPLAEIRALAKEMGYDLPVIRGGVGAGGGGGGAGRGVGGGGVGGGG
ncbi:MAG: DEAD/DEAH box helicase, partial [Dehalococcoidia bacterium]|nr:DEAD/DEAH box helicase [Dehalococcoidia bacterium]